MRDLTRAVRLFAVAVLTLSLMGTAKALDAPEGPVLLTVHGAVGKTNRGALDPFHDALLGFQGAEFDAAASFDRAMLEGLDGATIVTDAAGWPSTFTFAGPYLHAVLDAVGAEGEEVEIVAADGYAVTLSLAEVERLKPILALTRDGVPLAIGGRGPSWLIFSRSEFPELMAEEDDARWVWAVVRLSVR